MQSTDSSYNIPPFPAFPSTSRYVPHGTVQESLGRVCRSIDARDAIALVVGPPGTGKSLICGLLVEHYRDSHEVVVLGETPIENQAAFLRHLLHHLGADFSSIPDGDLQLALIDRVCAEQAPEGGLLIVVDEAQSLSTDVIESIRMVTNIMRDGEPRVFAVLCGGVKLDELLIEPSMEAFTQRVATRCYLHAMNGEETRRYVTETIRNCGAEPDETITAEAIAAVHHACGGVPRLINQMLTQAIDCAEEADQVLITEQVIDRAAAQLQQLPSPMVEEPKITRAETPIEFGELDDSINFGEWSPTSENPSSESSQKSENASCGFESNESDARNSAKCQPGECKTGECEQGHCEHHAASADSTCQDVAGGDIEFEHSSAQWIEEPAHSEPQPAESESHLDASPAGESISAAMPIEPTPSPAALFGQFDDEEELAVGDNFLPRAQPAPSAPAADLESMLHQEIVGMNPYSGTEQASEHTTAPIPDQEPTIETDHDTYDFDDEPEERVEDFITVTEEESDCDNKDNANPVLWTPDPAEDESGIRLADDSDILVIEDEVEVELHRIDAARMDAQDQTISVDFQAMLNRMRTSS